MPDHLTIALCTEAVQSPGFSLGKVKVKVLKPPKMMFFISLSPGVPSSERRFGTKVKAVKAQK